MAPRTAPGPRGFAAIPRNLYGYQHRAPEHFLALSRRYGTVVRVPLGVFTPHLISDPDGIHHVTQGNNQNYVRGLGFEKFKPFMGLGLLTSDGEDWRLRRRTANPMFHKQVVDSMAATMVETTAAVLAGWATPAHEQGINVLPEMMAATLGATGRIMFDANLTPHFPEVTRAMTVVVEAIFFRSTLRQLTPLAVPIPYNLQIRRARRVLFDISDRIIEAHRAGRPDTRTDLVDLLLSARDERTGGGLAHKHVRSEIVTTMLAGHESTATGLSWALYEVASHPEVQERMHAEIEQVLSGRTPTPADLERLPYTRMVVDESFRLHPPIWLFPRDSIKEDEIAGWHIPAGATLFMLPYVTHRNPDYWVDPERFDPLRFAPEQQSQRPRHAYYPFGAGQRKCIGAGMAILQTTLTLAMAVQRYRLRPVAGHPVVVGSRVTLRPLKGLKLAVEPRRR